MRSSPIAVSARMAAAMAIAPTTFGLPASSRSGRSAQATESVVTARTVPPPAWSGAGPNADRVPDEGTGAVRGVHLVGREGDEVEMTGIVVGAHVDRAVRRELGGVDEDPSARGMDLLGQLVHRLHDSGDVRRARHGEQRDATGVLGEAPIEILDIQAHRPGGHPREPRGSVLSTAGRSSGVRALSSTPPHRVRRPTSGRAC